MTRIRDRPEACTILLCLFQVVITSIIRTIFVVVTVLYLLACYSSRRSILTAIFRIVSRMPYQCRGRDGVLANGAGCLASHCVDVRLLVHVMATLSPCKTGGSMDYGVATAVGRCFNVGLTRDVTSP